MLKALGTDRYSVEEIQAWMDEHNLEIKRKKVHVPHNVDKFYQNEFDYSRIKGNVVYDGKTVPYIEKDYNGYYIIYSVRSGFVFCMWTCEAKEAE